MTMHDNKDMGESDSMLFAFRWIHSLEGVSDSEFRKMITAIVNYRRYGTKPDFTGYQLATWREIQDRIDCDVDHYRRTIEKRRNAGKQGANIRWQSHNTNGKNNKCYSLMAKMAVGDGEGDGDLKENTKENAEPFSLTNETDSVSSQIKLRVNALFRRQKTTTWSRNEKKALASVSKRDAVLDELTAIER